MIMWPKTLTLQSNPGDIDIPAFFIFLWFYSGWSYCADTGKQLKPLIRRRAKGRLSFTAEQRNFFGTHRPQFLVHTSQVLKVSRSRNKIDVPQLLQENERTNLFVFLEKFWLDNFCFDLFRDLLTFSSALVPKYSNRPTKKQFNWWW